MTHLTQYGGPPVKGVSMHATFNVQKWRVEYFKTRCAQPNIKVKIGGIRCVWLLRWNEHPIAVNYTAFEIYVKQYNGAMPFLSGRTCLNGGTGTLNLLILAFPVSEIPLQKTCVKAYM